MNTIMSYDMIFVVVSFKLYKNSKNSKANQRKLKELKNSE